jgi:hypothetical protein
MGGPSDSQTSLRWREYMKKRVRQRRRFHQSRPNSSTGKRQTAVIERRKHIFKIAKIKKFSLYSVIFFVFSSCVLLLFLLCSHPFGEIKLDLLPRL